MVSILTVQPCSHVTANAMLTIGIAVTDHNWLYQCLTVWSQNKTKGNYCKIYNYISDYQLYKKVKEGKTLCDQNKRLLIENDVDDLNNWFYEEPELDKWLAKYWFCVPKAEDYDSETEQDEDLYTIPEKGT